MSHMDEDKRGKEDRPKYQNDGEVGRLPAWGGTFLPENARCAYCNSAEISRLPSFSIGSGVAVRPVAEDVYCRRCGRIGVPVL